MSEKQLRQKFVNVAISYLNTKEKSEKHKYIIDSYNKISPLPQGYKVKYTDSWCAAFVSFCAKVSGLLDIVPAECSCPRQIELWKKLGKWMENDAYVPDVGDVIYYCFSNNESGDCKGTADHVGIVVSVSNGMIKVIEGNKSDQVGYRSIAVNHKSIRGFGLPKFSSKVVGNTETNTKGVFSMEMKTLSKGSKGEQVKALQILLIGRGFLLPQHGTDGSYGDETANAVKAFQKSKKITQDGIAGKVTFEKLLGVS